MPFLERVYNHSKNNILFLDLIQRVNGILSAPQHFNLCAQRCAAWSTRILEMPSPEGSARPWHPGHVPKVFYWVAQVSFKILKHCTHFTVVEHCIMYLLFNTSRIFSSFINILWHNISVFWPISFCSIKKIIFVWDLIQSVHHGIL